MAEKLSIPTWKYQCLKAKTEWWLFATKIQSCLICQHKLCFCPCPWSNKVLYFFLKLVIILFSVSFLADPFGLFTMSSSFENLSLPSADLFGETLNSNSTSTPNTFLSNSNTFLVSSSSDLLNFGKCTSGVVSQQFLLLCVFFLLP